MFKIREVSYYMVIFMISREAEVCFLLFAIFQKYDALPLQFDATENLNWYLRHLLLHVRRQTKKFPIMPRRFSECLRLMHSLIELFCEHMAMLCINIYLVSLGTNKIKSKKFVYLPRELPIFG